MNTEMQGLYDRIDKLEDRVKYAWDTIAMQAQIIEDNSADLKLLAKAARATSVLNLGMRNDIKRLQEGIV